MIISKTHKYLFIETPRTASTAIRSELKDHYQGKIILHKHANFEDLPKDVRGGLAGYTVFAGVRNPLDDAASTYQKLLTDHKNRYLDPTRWIENGGWVNLRMRNLFALVHSGGSFLDFLKAAYPHTYCSRLAVNKPHCTMFIRFEHLQQDFSAVLRNIGLKRVRELPRRNSTAGKRHFTEYYDQSTRQFVAQTFGPFLFEWGYIDDSDPIFGLIRQTDWLKYQMGKVAMRPYFRLARLRAPAVLRKRLSY